MRKVAKKSKSAAPSAPAPAVPFTPRRIREHLDRACALAKTPAPRKPSPETAEDAREAAALAAAPVFPGKKENSRESASPAPVPEPTGIRAARNGGFEVFLDGKFRGWHKTEDAAGAHLRKLAARKGLAALPPGAPAPAIVRVVPTQTPEPELAGSPAPVDLAAIAAEDARRADLVVMLADVPEDLFRAEAVRRGLLKAPAPAPAKARTDRRPRANREEHAELTKQAWTKARELAAAKGGKPTDHMKEAWAGLVRD